MNWHSFLIFIGIWLAIEGAMLLFIKDESWRRWRELIGKLSVGQLHTLGALMLAAGIVILAVV